MKDILKPATIPKVLFDVRNDSDVVYAHYGKTLRGVHDVQLMENASRLRRRFPYSLAKCCETDAIVSATDRKMWGGIKEEGKRLLNQTREVFNTRPLSRDVM